MKEQIKTLMAQKKLDAILDKMKKEADVLYYGNNPYGIIEWNDSEDIHPDFYQFCYDLPKVLHTNSFF